MLDIWMSGIARAGGIEVKLQRVEPAVVPVRTGLSARLRTRLAAGAQLLRGRLTELLSFGAPARHA